MKVYVVGYSSAYEGGDTLAVYSTRELAEASWKMRNEDKDSLWEITEFELDFDPNADEPDIDRRPMFGPKTRMQHTMNEAWNTIMLSNLTVPSKWHTATSMPSRTGNTIRFFAPSALNQDENKS